MTEHARASLDFRQNLSIAMLSVMAVFLFSRTELFHLGWEMMSRNFQAVSEPSVSEQEEALPYALSVPVRFAATGVYGGVYGRYVRVDMSAGDRAFRSARLLFGDALGESGDFQETSQDAFLLAVCGTSLYCDFLTPLPLSLLAGLMDTSAADERSVRSMALAREKNVINLYLWDGGGEYVRRPTAVSRRELEELVSRCELGNGAFALDLYDTESLYQKISPLSLLPETLPSLPVYASAVGLPDTGQLLSAFRFNPLTKSRYTEANGTEVIMEGGRSVRIRTNGNIYYQSGERGDLTIESAADVPTSYEAVRECAALLNRILIPQGCTPVCPLEVRRQGDGAVLRFGYALNGIPVFHLDGGAAAVVTLERRKIVSLGLRPRRYTATNTDSLLLPLEQASGIAGLYAGAELCLGYQDTGGSRLNARWFAASRVRSE